MPCCAATLPSSAICGRSTCPGCLMMRLARSLTRVWRRRDSPSNRRPNSKWSPQGFPHFTHLLAQSAARTALDAGRRRIGTGDVEAGKERAVERSDQSIREIYHKAATGVRKGNHWREAITACARAESDDRGYFSTRAVADQMGILLGRAAHQQTVAYHLGKLTEPDRGPLLQRTGPRRRYRYRFINPLMRPFVLMLPLPEREP